MTEYQHSPHPVAKDLRHEKPAAMNAKLAGYPWLPRMIDKARAAHAQMLGDYYRYPCPIDATCLRLLQIDADTFRQVATTTSDEDFIDALRQAGADTAQLAHFDPVHLNAELHDSAS